MMKQAPGYTMISIHFFKINLFHYSFFPPVNDNNMVNAFEYRKRLVILHCAAHISHKIYYICRYVIDEVSIGQCLMVEPPFPAQLVSADKVPLI